MFKYVIQMCTKIIVHSSRTVLVRYQNRTGKVITIKDTSLVRTILEYYNISGTDDRQQTGK